MGIYSGDSGANTLTGNGADTLYGLGGDDIIAAGAGDDALIGGAGNDTLTGGSGKDIFVIDSYRFDRDVVADFAIGTDKLDLSALGIADLDTLKPYLGQIGNDVVFSIAIAGDVQSITLQNVKLADLLASPSSFVFNGLADQVVWGGSAARDVLFGGNGADVLRGFNGNDDLNGGAGSDTLDGGFGDDTLRGGAGADMFRFTDRQFGSDIIKDFVVGIDRIDVRALGVGDLATLRPYLSQIGSDVVIQTAFGGEREAITIANVTIANLLAHPKSFLFGAETGPQVFNGTAGSDVLFGGLGADTLFGGKGADTLFGYGGFDTLSGGIGNDILIGGAGDDTLYGGLGADRFVLGFGDGYDTIMDFSRAQGDRIDLRSIDPDAAYGDQKLKLVTGDFTAAGQIRLFTHGGITTIFVNLDDNLKTDEVAIDVHSDALLTVADILL